METVSVPVRREVFERLQSLAIPLVDDASAVIERLIRHWESAPPQPAGASTSQPVPSPKIWRSARGEAFPVGAELRGHYRGKTYHARVTAKGIELNGIVYDNPSAAGIAAKRAAGTEGSAASTNGWTFWEMLHPDTQRWEAIDFLRTKVRA